MIQPSGDRKRVTVVMSEKERDRLVRFLSQALKTMPSSVLLRMTVNSIRNARVASWGRRSIYRPAEPGSAEALAYARDYPGSEKWR